MPAALPDPFVIRGGLFPEARHVLQAVEDAVEDGDGAIACVWVGSVRDGETWDGAVLRICKEAAIRNGSIRVAGLAALEREFRVVQDRTHGEAESHHNVEFPDPPGLEDAQRFVSCFDDPIPNPLKSRAS